MTNLDRKVQIRRPIFTENVVTSDEANETCSGVFAQLRTGRSHVDGRRHVNVLVISILVLMRLTRSTINAPFCIRTVTVFISFDIATSACPLSSRSPRSTWSRAVFQVIWTKVLYCSDMIFRGSARLWNTARRIRVHCSSVRVGQDHGNIRNRS